MASILKTKRKKTNTMKAKLISYLMQVVSITVVLVLLSVGFFLVTIKKYEISTSQLLQVNAFYTQLDSINAKVYEYTWGANEEVHKEIQNKLAGEADTIKQLLQMKISTTFYRDVLDIKEMFSNYSSSVNSIHEQKTLQTEGISQVESETIVNKDYLQIKDIYEGIGSEYKSLSSQLLQYTKEQESLFQQRNRIYFLGFSILVLLIFGFELFKANKLYQRILRPVQALTEGARKIEIKNLQSASCISEDIPSDEEMALLIHVFNKMITRIKKQVLEIKENAKAKEQLNLQELENLKISNQLKTSELKALQMQINPHFLFNTLNMISQTAYLENAEQTAVLIEKTAVLLRYLLDVTNKSVTLAKEMEILGDYVYLQEQRFGARIQFEFDLDESFHNEHVPSLILQPLVENAITHGVGMHREGAKICISTRYDEVTNKGTIEVLDNGAGMDSLTLEKVVDEMINTSEPEQKIGLSNVYLRLQLFFNQQAKMDVFSKLQEGTSIRIEIPVDF